MFRDNFDNLAEHIYRIKADNIDVNPNTPKQDKTAATQPAKDQKMADKKILIVYYSWSDGKNTKAAAEMIQKHTGGDIFRIEKVEPYPSEYKAVSQAAKEDLKNHVDPAIKPFDKNINDYDVVCIGSPIWSSTYATPVSTFLADVDLAGKTIVPFSTHGGGGPGHYAADVAKRCPNSTVLKDFTYLGKNIKQADPEIIQWLNSLGLD
jgi:flavodoxin